MKDREIEFLEEQIKENEAVISELMDRRLYLFFRLEYAKAKKLMSDFRILKLCHTGE